MAEASRAPYSGGSLRLVPLSVGVVVEGGGSTTDNDPTTRKVILMAKKIVDPSTGEFTDLEVKTSKVDNLDAIEYQEWLRENGIVIEDFDGGSAWLLEKDKDKLVGVPFVIADIRWNDLPTGNFVSVMCFLEDGTKIVFNDGGTGVYQQLKNYQERHEGKFTAIRVRNGLRRSDYDYVDSTGKSKPATTYYLA